MAGYCGKLLYVNLTDGSISEKELPMDVAKLYMGGSSLAAKLLIDMEAYKADPLDPENPFIVMTGPLTGTLLPGAGRIQVAARSPLTGGIGISSCGGAFGAQLKYAGFDGIIVTGASPSPVYLLVKDGTAELFSAEEIWGKVTSEVPGLIAGERGMKKVRSLCIGPAGENLVKYAAVMGSEHNAAGRTGLGAVMGSKKLKAIAVSGKVRPEVHDAEELDKIKDKIIKTLKEDTTCTAYGNYGTGGSMQLGMLVSDVPTKNWRMAQWEEGSDKLNGITMAETILSGKKSCPGCVIGCKRVVTIPNGPYKMEKVAGPEYESLASLGTLQMVDDLAAVCAANILCNDMGMDTISAGSSVAFLTECFERGLIDEKDTNGLRIGWGEPDTVIQLLAMAARREGIGDLLAEGVKRMSEKIGKGSEEFAVHSKGLEAPMHDPRAFHGLALAYATSPRGACHITHFDLFVEMGVFRYPEMGLDKDYPPLSRKGKAEMVANSENLGIVTSSAVLCMFTMMAMSVKNHLVPALNAATGMNWSVDDLKEVGQRGWLAQRSFNVLCGFTSDDDTLTGRILSPFLEGELSGLDNIVHTTTSFHPPEIQAIKDISNSIMNRIFPAQKKVFKAMGVLMSGKKLKKDDLKKKSTPDLEHMIREYYTIRELDREGRPRSKKLNSLKMNDVAETIETAFGGSE